MKKKYSELGIIKRKLNNFSDWIENEIGKHDPDSVEFKMVIRIANRFGNSFNEHLKDEGWKPTK